MKTSPTKLTALCVPQVIDEQVERGDGLLVAEDKGVPDTHAEVSAALPLVPFRWPLPL